MPRELVFAKTEPVVYFGPQALYWTSLHACLYTIEEKTKTACNRSEVGMPAITYISSVPSNKNRSYRD